jgi:hypothetical protein
MRNVNFGTLQGEKKEKNEGLFVVLSCGVVLRQLLQLLARCCKCWFDSICRSVSE